MIVGIAVATMVLSRAARNMPAIAPAVVRTMRRFESCAAYAVVALTDVLSDGLSMVYSFFDPEEGDRSLGTYMILDHIERAQSMGLPYVYLGYWVPGSRKMDYKGRFLPQERLMPSGWTRVES